MKRFAASLSLACFALFGAAPARAGEITGQVIEGGTRQPVANLEVALLLRGARETTNRAFSDAEGRFRFAGVAPGSYFVSTFYLEVPYARAALLVDPEARETVEIEVFRTTTSDEDIILRTGHMILQDSPETGHRVTEVLILENTGERTYLGAVSPASPTGHGMFISLPEGYADLTAPDWIRDRLYNRTELGVHLAMPLVPGTTQLTFSYALRIGPFGEPLDRQFPFAVKAFNVAVPLEADLRVRSGSLIEEAPVNIEGRRFLISTGGPFAKGAWLRARAWPGVMGRGLSSGQMYLGLGGLATALLGIVWIIGRGRETA